MPDKTASASVRGKTNTYSCKTCKRPFTARVADRARGWAKYCSKSCKAIKQTQRNGRGAGGKRVGEYAPGVSWERARADQIEYGGYPQYQNGECVGFQMGGGEMTPDQWEQ